MSAADGWFFSRGMFTRACCFGEGFAWFSYRFGRQDVSVIYGGIWGAFYGGFGVDEGGKIRA